MIAAVGLAATSAFGRAYYADRAKRTAAWTAGLTGFVQVLAAVGHGTTVSWHSSLSGESLGATVASAHAGGGAVICLGTLRLLLLNDPADVPAGLFVLGAAATFGAAALEPVASGILDLQRVAATAYAVLAEDGPPVMALCTCLAGLVMVTCRMLARRRAERVIREDEEAWDRRFRIAVSEDK